MAQKWGSSCTM